MAAGIKSYSVWVLPRGPLGDKLHAEIQRQASSRPDMLPVFLPHVTLVGGVHTTETDMLCKAQQLSTCLKPYRISFDRVSSGSAFHQCVYLLCKPDHATLEAGREARRAYGLDPNSPYMPHLSLVYGDLTDTEKDEIVKDEHRCLLEGPAALLGDDERGFDVTSVAVWETEESDRSLRSWHQVAEYPLRG